MFKHKNLDRSKKGENESINLNDGNDLFLGKYDDHFSFCKKKKNNEK